MFSEYSTLIIAGLIVLQGYFISRVLEFAGITDSLSKFFLRKSKGSVYRLLFLLICYIILMSLFISNVICILTLIPILVSLKDEVEGMGFDPKTTKRFVLIILFMGMYSVNLGGLGTMTASPSHLILMGFLAAKKIPGYEQVNFFNWFLWGLPLVFILGLVLYVVCLFFIPKEVKKTKLVLKSLNLDQDTSNRYHIRLGTLLTIISFILWFGVSIVNEFFKDLSVIISLFTLLYTLFLFLFIFYLPIKQQDGSKSPLVPAKALVTGIPTNGLLIIIISVIVSYLATYLPIEQFLSEEFISIERVIKENPLLLIVIFGAATIFLSEIFSNTLIMLMLFGLAVPFAIGNVGVPLMLSISLLATIPSMTPMASPVNALLLGSIKGSFNRDFMLLGLIMNIVSTLVVSFFSYHIIVWILKFYL